MHGRTLLYCVVALLLAGTSVAFADDPPVATQKGEVIVIEGSPPAPAIKAKPPARWLPYGTLDGKMDNAFPRKAPKYSEKAIENDRWSMAWLLLDIDKTGAVTRVKFLKYPGNDLEAIAVETALELTFEPARDADGNPVRSWLAFPIEWPSYWWLVDRTGLATAIPDTSKIPCRGTGEHHLESHHPAYRDCDPPDWSMANTEPWRTTWVEKKKAKKTKKK